MEIGERVGEKQYRKRLCTISQNIEKKKYEYVTNSGIQIGQFVENPTTCGLNFLYFLRASIGDNGMGTDSYIEQSRAK